jgi:hypothetical protein
MRRRRQRDLGVRRADRTELLTVDEDRRPRRLARHGEQADLASQCVEGADGLRPVLAGGAGKVEIRSIERVRLRRVP